VGKSRDEKKGGLAECAPWICSGVRRKVVVIDIPGA
jgi:hypothetical protein